VTEDKENTANSEFVLLPAVDWRRVEEVTTDRETARRILSGLYATSAVDPSPEDAAILEAKRSKLSAFLHKHNLSVEAKGASLLVQNCVTVNPPYTPDHCRATNEIVLDRVSDLIRQCFN